MKVWITREPWEDAYCVRLVAEGDRPYVATSVVDGQIVFSEQERMTVVEPFLKLRPDVLEAFARAVGHVTQASDQTIDALKDTREVRDRLLSLVERSAA